MPVRSHGMKTKLNGRFLVGLLLTLTVVAVGTWFLHKSQVRRNAGVLYDLATEAEEGKNFARAADYYKRYLALAPTDIEALEKYGTLLNQLAVFPDPRGRRRAFLILERVVREEPERRDLRRQLIRIAMSPDLQRTSDALAHLKIFGKSPFNDAEPEV